MRALHKKLFRSMLRSWSQTLAVLMVVLCGVASYICVYSAYLNLSLTRDAYYRHQRLADFEIRLERAPATAVFKVENIEGVRQARGRIVKDVNVDIEGIGEPRIGRVVSMPNPRRAVMDDIVLQAGRYFDSAAQDEVILSDRFAAANGLEIGDRIEITVDDKKYSLRIVGQALSPEYVYMIRSVQDLIPEPERFGILWVPEDFAETALDMSDACNSILGMTDDPKSLDRILEQAGDLLDSYGVYAKTKQEDQLSARFLGDEIKGLGISAKVVPTLFLGIAALIILVLLNRMVRTERTQIGLMKAYGYSNFAVALHYLEYAFILSVLGALGGFGLGQWLAGGMIRMYVQFYSFPILESRIYPSVLARSMGSAVAFALAGALLAAIRAAQIQPAESMRPEAPAAVHQVWLERLPRLWHAFSFTWKMILRNIARNPYRAALNVFGVAISTGLLIMGFFSMDSMDFGMRFQFQRVQREDVKISFQREHGKETLHEVARFGHVRRAEPVLDYPFELRLGWRKKDIVVTGIEHDAELQHVMNFSGEEFEIPDTGLILSDRLARTLDIEVGDKVRLKPLMGRITRTSEVTVVRLAEEFLGAGAYMNIEALSRMLDEPFAMNGALLRTEAGSKEALNKELKEIAGIAAVGYTSDAYESITNTIRQSMNITNTILLMFAGVIAFSIIYNVTSVSLSERQRELSSLRVLGLTPAETGRILYHENFLLGGLGVLAGIPIGYGICRLLVKAYDNDLYRLPFTIDRQSYIIAMLLTIACIALANLAVRRKIHRLDLVEVLKERE